MSWSIPTKIEADIQDGLAEYKTFNTGMGGQTVLAVPPNAYIVIFGMDYMPGGGGYYETQIIPNGAARGNFTQLSQFQTQQVSFWTGNQFYPFMFRTPLNIGGLTPGLVAGNVLVAAMLAPTSIGRQVYIRSTNDVAITVGSIRNVGRNTISAIPVSNATPPDLTYGGSAQTMNVQSDFSSAAVQPVQFLQPNPELFNTLGFGIPPAGQSDQAFAKPDATNGLIDITNTLAGFGGTIVNGAANNYFLTLHYAIYSSAPDERFI